MRTFQVDVLFPAGNGDGGHAVADQVGQRPANTHEPVHRQYQHQAHHRDRRHGGQGGGEDYQRRAWDAVSALGGHQRHQQNGQQVGHLQRCTGGVGNEHDGQGQVDGKTVEVERVAGGDDQADGGTADAQVFQLAHDLRQHGVGRSGAEDDGQLFTQVLDERQQLKARHAHHRTQHNQHEAGAGQVEQCHQAAQVLQ